MALPSSKRSVVPAVNGFGNAGWSCATGVELAVYDVAGRLQKRLDSRAIAVPGSYSVAWDGTDENGRRVPAGVYFYRLVTAQGVQTARVVRIQ